MAKINEAGALMIRRAGRFKIQTCPYKDKFCGDWCPLFGVSGDRDEIFVGCFGYAILMDLEGDERK